MLTKWLLRVFAVTLGLVILFISFARAGLSLMAQDEGFEVLKNEEVKFMATFTDGETISGTYKLSQPGMLPTNVMYGFKRVRDYLWVALSSGNNKIKVLLLLADKNVGEFEKLSKKGVRNTAIESGNEAVDKLKYASELIGHSKNSDTQSKELQTQLLWAGLAYQEVFRRNEKEHQIDSEKYTILLARIDEWNKKAEKNRYNWNY